jgi:8-oxo-dGTP pyrophosphatase MutT (NUDIX family)
MAEPDENAQATQFPGVHHVRIDKGEQAGPPTSNCYSFEIDGRQVYPSHVSIEFAVNKPPKVTMTINAIVENAELLADLAATLVDPQSDSTPPKVCDNTSVGILILSQDADRWLFFDRNTFPAGVAPAAGHVDRHGTPVEAAVAEVQEETGLTVTSLQWLTGGWRDNACRRAPGPMGTGHLWSVYMARASGQLNPSLRETRNVRWLDRSDLQDLANRTIARAQGHVTDQQFAQAPGLEPVWIRWLISGGLVTVSEEHLHLIDALISASAVEPRTDESLTEE